MESCHHKQKKYNIRKYFPTTSFAQMVRLSLDMLTEFCISHSLESCLALCDFSWSHSNISRLAHFLQEKAVATRQFKCYHEKNAHNLSH